MKEKTNETLQSLNDEILAGLSVEELEDRLEMQILGGAVALLPQPNGKYFVREKDLL